MLRTRRSKYASAVFCTYWWGWWVVADVAWEGLGKASSQLLNNKTRLSFPNLRFPYRRTDRTLWPLLYQRHRNHLVRSPKRRPQRINRQCPVLWRPRNPNPWWSKSQRVQSSKCLQFLCSIFSQHQTWRWNETSDQGQRRHECKKNVWRLAAQLV